MATKDAAQQAAETIRDELRKAGVGEIALAGVLGNAEGESGLDPTSVGDGGTSVGLFQWHDERANALMDWSQARGLNARDAGTQTAYLLDELKRDYPKLLQRMEATGNPRDAAMMFQREFEKPAKLHPERGDFAESAWKWQQRSTPQAPIAGAPGETADVPRPAARPGFIERVVEGAKEGFGPGPIGASDEAKATGERLGGPLGRQAVASVGGVVDLISRLAGGATGALAGATGGALQAGGASPTTVDQAQRDVKGLADMALVAGPLASPTGLVTPRTLMPRVEPVIENRKASATEAPPPEGMSKPVVAPEATPRPVAEAAPTLASPAEAPASAGAVAQPTSQGLPAAPLRPPALILDPATGVRRPNLARITTTDEARNLIGETAEVYREEMAAAGRGVQSHEATRALADQLAVTPDRVTAEWSPGHIYNAEQMLAARDTLATSADQVMTLARAAKDNPGEAMNSALFQALNRHRALQEAVTGATTEAGRLLNSFNIMSRDGRTRVVKDILDNSGGQWETIVDRLSKARPEELPAVIRDLPGASTADRIHSLWINALLSGPQTHAANILGNSFSSLASFTDRLVGEGLGRAGRAVGIRGGIEAGETAAMLGGRLRGMIEGFSGAFDSLWRGVEPGASKLDNGLAGAMIKDTGSNPIAGAIGKALGVATPTRWLAAEDSFFKAIAYRGEIWAQATRQARREGLRGDALRMRIADLKRNPSEGMKLAAERASAYDTFQSELGNVGKAVQKLQRAEVVGGVRPMAWVIPFVKTPINLIKWAAEHSPLGLARLTKKGADPAFRQSVIAQAVTGSVAMLYFADLADQGLITGSGPSDPEERMLWLQDHQPYSILWDGQWVSYDRMDPLSMQIGTIADIVDRANKGTLAGKELEDTVTDVGKSFLNNLTSKTWLQGPISWAMALADPDRYGDRSIYSLASSVVPSIVNQAAQIMDVNPEGEQVARMPTTIAEALQARIPGERDTLQPIIDTFGQPVTSLKPLAPLLGTKVKSAELNPLAEAMRAAGYFPGKPVPKWSLGKQTVDLSDDPAAVTAYRRAVGKSFAEAGSMMIASQRWFTLSSDDQQTLLRKAMDLAREKAQSRFYETHGGLHGVLQQYRVMRPEPVPAQR